MLNLVSKSYVHYPTGSSQPKTDAYDAALKNIAEKVSQRGARLVVIGPNPVLSRQEMMALKPEWFFFTAMTITSVPTGTI